MIFDLKPLWETENHSLIYFLKYQLKTTGRLKLIAGRLLKMTKTEVQDYRTSWTLFCWLKYLLPSLSISLNASEISRDADIYKCNKHMQNKYPVLNPINFSTASRTTKTTTTATIQVPLWPCFYVLEGKIYSWSLMSMLGPTTARCKYETQFMRIRMCEDFFS